MYTSKVHIGIKTYHNHVIKIIELQLLFFVGFSFY